MTLKTTLLILMLLTLSFSGLSCSKVTSGSRNRLDENNFPSRIIWAWERPEDLEFLDAREFGVAFLAQTLILRSDEVIYKPRRQPLKVAPQTKLIAVTRIESQNVTGGPSFLTGSQREKLLERILNTLDLPNVSAIQIDFDAAQSERSFYRTLLQELRNSLPDKVPLSMTALASFCVGDLWIEDLPVDEAVPMIFRMGADDRSIKSFLADGNDFNEPLCRQSYGIAVDEPVQTKFDDSRRQYVFNVRSWTQQDVLNLQSRAGK